MRHGIEINGIDKLRCVTRKIGERDEEYQCRV